MIEDICICYCMLWLNEWWKMIDLEGSGRKSWRWRWRWKVGPIDDRAGRKEGARKTCNV